MDCGIILPSVSPNSNYFSVHASPRSPCIMVRCQQKEGQVKNNHHYNELPLLKRKRPTMINIPVDRSLENNNIMNTSRVRVQEVEVEEDGYGVYSKKGISRTRLEDRYSANFASDAHGKSKQALFGIFDGHGGAKAAEFAAAKLGNIILDYLRRGDKSMIEENIKNGYLAADEEFLKGNATGGVCCVTALVQHGSLIVSNVGDCRAVISKAGVAEPLTNDHNPSREDEKLRIESKGGYVDCCNGVWRIQGSLAVSRAIGDQHLKQWVTAEPDTQILTIKPDFQFLILASDGLWNKVSNQEAVDVIQPFFTAGSNKPELKNACRKLVELSISRGSNDDTSVMVVQLDKFAH
ncbi:probable protein phosphatase 2C 30 [Amaranthus tricolor]|uniref:probable protein phosphatase 2C 30 n=1 Tax=Amaranthus tricolor TaxID=29722 RepID=UPI002583E04C|nr:probable protein phosphatase 2C 30 [Amaranthus tricolor]